MRICKDATQINKINRRIEICGGIASGKTTFATLLANAGFISIYEAFREVPFWKAFYADPVKYAFETEITFTLQHYHQIKKHPASNKFLACDYSFLLDMAYAEMGLKDSQLSAFKAVYLEIEKELSAPALVVHLQCDSEIELDRICSRGRNVEKNITLNFLRALNDAVSKQIEKAKMTTPILTIDSAKNNFAFDETVKKKMLEMVTTALAVGEKCQ
ncbi:hypothetical protein GFER_02240 [Geoalkalibacter ferrihydriticus DSM 17813]|uniref:Deoxynucleoside kinase domain-containing protein n=2 Tax=Geoalkalibacter ferrihydriticus TaxID=392333 RepID=A0A0C2EFY0_9BACT|nr:deoxynucleoside kinase [Geoalkalibacter ferrihydriticus]KIH77538.1 hypothetical protein GFER_02240 [Geoalkalibacter ferrihydriticus DSM 17813]